MNTVMFPNKEAIEASAASWIAALDRGLQPMEEVELDKWLEESPLHGEALVKCASMWDLLDVLEPIAKLFPMEEGDFGAAHSAEASPQVFVQPGTPWLKFAVAASLLMAMGALTYSFIPVSPEQAGYVTQTPVNPTVITPAAQPQTQAVRYQTEVGEVSAFTLDDGSQVELNTDSEVIVSFSEQQRDIKLVKGEAFFTVAKNPNKPFVVEVGEERVTAVGTAFSIDLSSPVGTEVFVTEGKVRVNRANSERRSSYPELFLTPGQKVFISETEANISTDLSSDSLLAWRQGMLVFEGESLAEVILEIDRYTPMSFKIVDQSIAEIPVGGFFKTGDLEQLLLVLEQNFGVSSYRLGEEILLSKK